MTSNPNTNSSLVWDVMLDYGNQEKSLLPVVSWTNATGEHAETFSTNRAAENLYRTLVNRACGTPYRLNMPPL